jgi:hypothetical protein
MLRRASFLVLAVAVSLITGFELPGGTTLMAIGAFFGAVGLYCAYRDNRRQRSPALLLSMRRSSPRF